LLRIQTFLDLNLLGYYAVSLSKMVPEVFRDRNASMFRAKQSQETKRLTVVLIIGPKFIKS
jgi:hypothetical protein